MATTHNHVIEKVLVEVVTKNKETAFYFSDNIGGWLKDEIFPKIEVLLNSYSSKDLIVRFDEISLDFKVKNWKNPSMMTAEILHQLESKLTRQISLHEIRIFHPDTIDKGDERIQKVSLTQNTETVFLFYLGNGYLPWFGKSKVLDELVVVANWEKRLKSSTFIEKTKAVLMKEEQAVQRFIKQFSDEMIVQFLATINPDIKRVEKQILYWTKKMAPGVRIALLDLIFSISLSLSKQKINQRLSVLLFEIQGELSPHKWNAVKEILFFVNDFMSQNLIDHKQFNAIFKSISTEKGTADRQLADFQKNMKEEFSQSQLQLKVKSAPKSESPFFENKRGEIAIQNAGLILLHPFLKTFFVETGVADTLGMLKNDKPDLAVQVLHFLASGEENAFEGDLIFEKFLCGIPLKMPIERQSLLTVEIKLEAENVLTAVIGHWPELKNTSPDGLRQMFLQRSGKLVQNENNYRLIVERKAQDILLEKLSWSLSMVKLPWMDKLITIEW